MARSQLISKPVKSSLKGKIIKRKTVKPTVEVKKKLKMLAEAELEQKQVSPPILIKMETPKPKLKIQLRNRPPVEDDESKKRINIDDDQVQRGVIALYKLLEKTKKKPELFDADLPIYLQVNCVKVPQTPIRLIRFDLKHSLVTESSEICLIVGDKSNKKDHDSTIEHYENLLRESGITNIKTIIPFNQFKHENASQFELKRRFLNLYDFFLVDGRVNGLVTHLLGSIFYKKRKMPASVKMNDPKLKEQIEHILKKSAMKLHSNSDSYCVQVGHTGMSQEQVAENVIQVAEELDHYFPGGFNNVRSLGVKTDKSLSIPVYLTLKKNKRVYVPICKPKRPIHYSTVKGSLSTYLNAVATVTPEGDVTLKTYKLKKNDKIPAELRVMNEDEIEQDDADEVIEEHKEELNSEKNMDASNMEQSDDDDDDLAKEEEMYLTNYVHEQDHDEQEEQKKQATHKKRKNGKGKK